MEISPNKCYQNILILNPRGKSGFSLNQLKLFNKWGWEIGSGEVIWVGLGILSMKWVAFSLSRLKWYKKIVNFLFNEKPIKDILSKVLSKWNAG